MDDDEADHGGADVGLDVGADVGLDDGPTDCDVLAEEDLVGDLVEPELVVADDNEEEIVFHINLSESEPVRGDKSKNEKGVQVDVGITSELKNLRRENQQLKI